MLDYQRTTKVDASPDALFRYLSDIRNLPKYFSRMTSASRAGHDEVRVTARVHGKGEEGKAQFHVDQAARKLRWSSEGTNDYHGELEVSGSGKTSQVAVKLHTNRGEREEIERGLEETLNNIARLVEEDAERAA